MRNGFLVSVILIMIAIIILAGILVFRNIENDINPQSYGEEDKNNVDINIEIVETAGVEEEKVSPNCMFVFKTYYARCDHIKIEKEQVSETMVNKTRAELEKIYKNWQIVTFRSDEVLFYRELEETCDEHYVLRELDGCVAVYTLGEDNIEVLKEKTDILVEYLEEEDINRLKEGIIVSGKDQLNRTLEDYE